MDLSTGLFVLNKTDLAIADVLPLVLTRTYRRHESRAFGRGANHNLNRPGFPGELIT